MFEHLWEGHPISVVSVGSVSADTTPPDALQTTCFIDIDGSIKCPDQGLVCLRDYYCSAHMVYHQWSIL